MTKSRSPYLDAGMRGFLFNTARAEYWRVADWYDFEDLLQDGYMCYAKCFARYTFLSIKKHPTKADRSWMMALVKTTFYNHIHTLASRNMQLTEIPVSQLTSDKSDGVDFWEFYSTYQQELVSFLSVLESVPSEVMELIGLLATDKDDELKRARTRLKRYKTPAGKTRIRVIRTRRKFRETTNEYYCRLLGIDPLETDVSKMVGELREAVEIS